MTKRERVERCIECQGFGDDYYRGSDGEMHCACDECEIGKEDEDDEL